MKVYKLTILLVCLCFYEQTVAQFNGGTGDGFSVASRTKALLTNEGLLIYYGGNGDGFAVNTSVKNLLTDEAITIYFGGNGDGFAVNTASIPLSTNVITAIFNGGVGDGFAVDTSVKNLLLDEAVALYFGGNGDGFAVDTSIKNLLLNEAIALYFGGNGDGFAVNQESLILLEQVRANIIAFLQGPSLDPTNKGLMNDILRANNLIPISSPFGDSGIVDPSIFEVTGSDAIVDWVYVELRNSLDTSDILAAKSALIQRDGDIVDLDGSSPLAIEIPLDDYYVVVKHRNHLGVMTANPISLTGFPTTIDFSDINNQITFGTNAQTQVGFGKMAFWAGDANGDKVIQFSGGLSDANAIKDHILADPANILNFITFSSSGYLSYDIDLNSLARFSGAANDSNTIKDNVLTFPGNILGLPTYTINSTVPPTND